MHTVYSIPNRMAVYADELTEINERLKRINVSIIGGRNVIDRPPVPPPALQAPPGQDLVIEDANFCDAFEYQNNQITYKLDYARAMLDNLETFTSNNKQAGGEGAQPANFQAGNKTRPY